MKHIKLFEGFLNESSYTDFLSKYGDEINESIKKLKILSGIDEIDEETYKQIEEKLKVYDTNVPKQIMHWISLSKHQRISADEIARFALENMNRWGTEMQMVLYAIDDYFDIVDRKYNISPEEEE